MTVRTSGPYEEVPGPIGIDWTPHESIQQEGKQPLELMRGLAVYLPLNGEENATVEDATLTKGDLASIRASMSGACR